MTIYIGIRYKGVLDENKAVAEKKDKEKPAPAVKLPPAKSAPTVLPEKSRPAKEEEEEERPIIPASNPMVGETAPAKTPEPKLPDIGPILPKLPGPDVPATKSGGPDSKPPATKPTEPKSDPGEPPVRGDGQIPPALLAKLKAATVYIKRHAGRESATGSGFVLRVSGDTALIVTNEHVAVPKAKQGVARIADHEVVFHSGRKNEFTKKASLIAADEEHDLAILRVSGAQGKDFPEPLNTTDKPSLAETMPVYIIGFPFGQELSTTRGNPGVTIGKGTISSLREDDVGDTAFIQIDGDVNPGNSGGPVVDARGRLVGVTVAKLEGTHIGIAIPPIELSRVLTGRVSNLMFRMARSAGKRVEIDVKGDLVDPLERVKSTSVRVVRADELKERPTVGAGGRWSALERAEKTDFQAKGNTVLCRVQLPVHDRDRGKIEFYFQPACVDRDGKTNYFAPVMATLKVADGSGENPFQPFPAGPGTGPGGGPPGFPMPPGAGPPGGFPMPGFPGGPGTQPGRPPGGGPPAPPPLPPPPKRPG